MRLGILRIFAVLLINNSSISVVKAGGLIVISETRLNEICGNWSQNNINRPPGSGKTTLAKVLTKHLKSRGFVVKYITFAHWRQEEFPDLLSNNDGFDAFWRKVV